MRRGGKRVLLAVLAAPLFAGLLSPTAQASPPGGGLTVTPAALSLILPPGAAAQSTEFTLTNTYTTPISLVFGFEPTQSLHTNTTIPAQVLSLSRSNMVVEPGQTARQIVTMTDDAQLSPGSHAIDLVITQLATTDSITALPSVRIPLALLKQEGAVSALSLGSFATSGFAWQVPGSLSATIKNQGNVIAIPRGVMTITSAGGNIIRQGTINLASQAIAPGSEQQFNTSLTRLGDATWPGVYKATLQFGLGGDQPATTVTRTFIFVAWWHVIVVALTGAGCLALVKYRDRLLPLHRMLRRLTAGRMS